MRKNSVIAAVVPPALLAPFYLWIGAIWMFVGRPPWTICRRGLRGGTW